MPETGARALGILVGRDPRYGPTDNGTRPAPPDDRPEPGNGHDVAVAAEDRDRPRPARSRSRASSPPPSSAEFPFADVPFAGVATIVVTDDDAALARRYADQLARRRRAHFTIRPTPVADAVAEAMAAPTGSVYVLADIGDLRRASGTAGDGTVVLKGLLDAGARSAAVAQIMDPEAGRRLHRRRGGPRSHAPHWRRFDDLHGPPLEVAGIVRLIHRNSFPLAGPMGAGTVASHAAAVVLEVGGAGGIEVQLTELRGHPWPELLPRLRHRADRTAHPRP